jgi:hypothetical protein
MDSNDGSTQRRTFLTTMVGAAALAVATRSLEGVAQNSARENVSPEIYVWRQYTLRNGTQPRRLADFLQAAYIPAVNRLGHKPVGVFEVTAGLPAPTVSVLNPFASFEVLGSFEAALDRDEQFSRSTASYLDAAATDPVYVRQDASLLTAFPNLPRIEVPTATAAKGPRLFELRTYESHNERAHRAKVRMFTEMGEVDIFRRCGLTPVFFSRTLVGPRMPSLVYMLVHENMAAREKSWDAFRNDPEWKKVASETQKDGPIVANVVSVFMTPTDYSPMK